MESKKNKKQKNIAFKSICEAHRVQQHAKVNLGETPAWRLNQGLDRTNPKQVNYTSN